MTVVGSAEACPRPGEGMFFRDLQDQKYSSPESASLWVADLPAPLDDEPESLQDALARVTPSTGPSRKRAAGGRS